MNEVKEYKGDAPFEEQKPKKSEAAKKEKAPSRECGVKNCKYVYGSTSCISCVEFKGE